MRVKKIILIGGAPTTGKSTIAKKLAQHLELPWISTDQLRAVVKPYAYKNEYPELLHSENLTAEQFLSKYTPQEVCDKEFAQARDVWPGIKALLAHDAWSDGCVIEGVNIVPKLMVEDYPNKEHVTSLFLLDLNEERMREVVYTRGLYAKANTYSDGVKPLEVEWAMLFAKKLKLEAIKYKQPWVEMSKTEEDFQRVLQAIDE